jgi:hypothetical protein
MPTVYETKYATTSQGGYLVNSQTTGNSWQDVIDATTATGTFVNSQYIYTRASYTTGRSGVWACGRSCLVFNTSITYVKNVIAAELYLYVDGYLDVNYTPYAVVQRRNQYPNLTDVLVAGDYDNQGIPVPPNLFSFPFTSTGGWTGVTLNQDAINYININAEVTLVLKDSYYDYDYALNLTDPPGDGYLQFFHNESGKVPYLYLTLDTGYGQIVNSIIPANFDVINGFSKINVDKLNGVTG